MAQEKGDKVEEGDILAEIETDKATMEFESFSEGTLLYIGIQEGETAKVDKLLAIIGEEGEDISSLIDGGDADDDAVDEEDVDKDDADEDDAEESDNEDSDDDAEDSEEDDDDDSEDEKDDSDEKASGEIPDDVEVVNMPRLSDTMEEGTVAAWLKKKAIKWLKVISWQKSRPIRPRWNLNHSMLARYFI